MLRWKVWDLLRYEAKTMRIPRVMSTQHPDNVLIPFFAESQDMSGDAEIQEAYYAFSHLGCDEQMWDCEGKEVDNFVIRKLLTQYEQFFRENIIGRDLFITLRTPNPTVEKEEAKVLLETLESIPRSFDTAKAFYRSDNPPIFEVILPMTTSAKCLNRIYYYYKDFVAGKKNHPFYPGDITIAEWIGEFRPERINVIPLFEDKEHMLEAHNIVREYLKDKDVKSQRVFLARSDPATNYGMISAVLLNKIALKRLRSFSDEEGIEIYPILGVGSSPFRGNLKPSTVDSILSEFPDVQTFTVQSAFKYDNPVPDVVNGIRRLKESPRGKGIDVDEKRCLEIIDKISIEYARQIEMLAPIVNHIAQFIPRRRMRRLHIGLFGYSRSIGKIRLPRAIVFCAACYSIGLPPEILGLNVLDRGDLEDLKKVYMNFDTDIEDALSYFNEDVLDILPAELRHSIKGNFLPTKINTEHRDATSRIIEMIKAGKEENLQQMVVEAAHLRGFLG